jgi:hypothetical protein
VAWIFQLNTHIEGDDDAGRVVPGQLDGRAEEAVEVVVGGDEPGRSLRRTEPFSGPSIGTELCKEGDGLPERRSSRRRTLQSSRERTRFSSPNSGENPSSKATLGTSKAETATSDKHTHVAPSRAAKSSLRPRRGGCQFLNSAPRKASPSPLSPSRRLLFRYVANGKPTRLFLGWPPFMLVGFANRRGGGGAEAIDIRRRCLGPHSSLRRTC